MLKYNITPTLQVRVCVWHADITDYRKEVCVASNGIKFIPYFHKIILVVQKLKDLPHTDGKMCENNNVHFYLYLM
jgi:hypothetical protein